MSRHASPAETSGAISRRSHPKSRKGCQLCKTRKIKCDETRPSCQNCTKHGVPCPYTASRSSPMTPLSLQSPHSEATTSSIPAGIGISGVGVGCGTGETSFDMLDLELLHNFTTATFATLTSDPVVRDTWRLSSVRIALQCDYVMRALLAVSGMHIAHYRPQAKRDVYVGRAIDYHRSATRSVMAVINEGNAKNFGEHLYLFSSLTVYFALASPKSEEPLFLGDDFPDWLYLLRGNRRILEIAAFRQEDYQGPLLPFLEHGKRRWKAQHDPSKTRKELLSDLQQRVRESVQENRAEDAERLLPIYDTAISELRQALSVVLASDGRHLDIYDAFIWQFVVADDFVPLLKVPEQEAVAIFAHFCILLKKLENQWWLQGWGDHLISKAWGLLDQQHRLWIQWPISEIGWLPPE